MVCEPNRYTVMIHLTIHARLLSEFRRKKLGESLLSPTFTLGPGFQYRAVIRLGNGRYPLSLQELRFSVYLLCTDLCRTFIMTTGSGRTLHDSLTNTFQVMPSHSSAHLSSSTHWQPRNFGRQLRQQVYHYPSRQDWIP